MVDRYCVLPDVVAFSVDRHKVCVALLFPPLALEVNAANENLVNLCAELRIFQV